MKLVALTLALALAVPATAATAPRVTLTSVDQLAQPLPVPYDTEADADAQVAAAKKLAKKTGKLLLIDLGGNWCSDCRVLAAILELPEVKAFVARHYVVVAVDIGRRDKNEQVAAAYGASIEGVPAVLIVNPKTDKLLNPDAYAALSDARNMTPQGLADWLAKWV